MKTLRLLTLMTLIAAQPLSCGGGDPSSDGVAARQDAGQGDAATTDVAGDEDPDVAPTLDDVEEVDIEEADAEPTDVEPTDAESTPDSIEDEAPDDPQADCARQPLAVAPTLNEVRINGQRMLHSTAPSEVGVLFLFHGNGGGPDVWVARTEHVIVTLEALERGLLVAALKSVDTGWGKQCCEGQDRCCERGACCTDEVADIDNVRAALAHLIDASLVTADAPVYALGYSNGGGFTGRLTQGLALRAAATVNSGSGGAIIRNTDAVPPIFFQGAQQDPIVDPDAAVRNHQSFETRGLRTALRINGPAPLTPGRFSRIDGIDCETSINIFEGLRRAELIDAAGNLQATPNEIVEAMEATAFWRNNGLDVHAPNITLQLRELDAQHAFSSAFSGDLFDFLLADAE